MDLESHTHAGHDHCTGNNEYVSNDAMKHGLLGDTESYMRKKVLRRLWAASMLCLFFLLVEVIGGLIAGSLAVLSDAAHLLADLASFAIAIGASHIASLPPTATYTFGLKRTEALAALFSMVSLALVSAGLAVEAVHRLWPVSLSSVPDQTVSLEINSDVDVDGKLMSIIATIGVVVNIALALILGENHVHMPGTGGHEGHDHTHSHSHDHGKHDGNHDQNAFLTKERKNSYGSSSSMIHSDELPHDCNGDRHVHPKRNINLHAAYLHVLGDLLQSVAVLIAGLVIWVKPGWHIVDPICTLLFAIMVFWSTVGVIRASVSVLLEEVPPNLSWDKVHEAISSLPGVCNVHDLHIWSISHGAPALSVHASAPDTGKALADISIVCRKFNITHSTIQVQPSTVAACVTCGEGMLQCK